MNYEPEPTLTASILLFSNANYYFRNATNDWYSHLYALPERKYQKTH